MFGIYPDGKQRGVGGTKNYSVYQPTRAPTTPAQSPVNKGGKGAAPSQADNYASKAINPNQGKGANPQNSTATSNGKRQNALGGYVVPDQTYTGHTSSVDRGGDKGRMGVGGGIANPIQMRPDATSILARPDLQSAKAPTQLKGATKGSLDPVTPVTNRGNTGAPVSVPNAIVSSGAE